VRQALKTCSKVLLVGFAAFAVAFAQDARYDGETMQVFLSISGAHRENVMSYIAPRLKERFGIDLVAEEIGSADMVQRISVQRDNPRISIAHWDVAVAVGACESGLCAPIDQSLAPAIGGLPEWALIEGTDGELYVLTTSVLGVGLLYNEEAFERAGFEPPTSWQDLLRPELAGRTSVTALESTMGTAALVMFAQMNGGGVDNIDPGFEFVQEVLPNLHTIHTWSSEAANLMQLNEVWLSTQSSNIGLQLRLTGLPIRWIAPEEGSPMSNGGVSIIANAPYQDVAHAYLELYYSPEFQALRFREGGVTTPLPAAYELLTDEEIAQSDLTPADFDRLVAIDWEAIGQVRSDWIERWHREIR
jgi:putative spermidine/putrescine transport system substrate-binding protein